MTTFQAVILGLVQGLTEFLPVSSSGHLTIVPWLFGWDLNMSLDLEKTFDVALHLGTFIAVLALMWRDVWMVLKAFFGSIWRRSIKTNEEKLAWMLVISTIPAGLIGVAFEDFIQERLGQPWLIAILIIVFGFIIWGVDARMKRTKTLDTIRWYHALLIGVAQAMALAPGVSRSGVTITALRGLSIERKQAVRYSFLLALPIIGGGALYKGAKVFMDGGLPAGTAMPFLVGVITAAVSGFIAAWFLLRYVSSHSFRPFVWYRLAFGIMIIVLILAGIRSGVI